MPKVNGRDIFETKPWLNDDPQNIEQYSEMVSASAPSGTIEISANGEYDVSEYATADVQVEGGGSSDFSTAEVTFVNNTGAMSFANIPICVEENAFGVDSPAMVYYLASTPDATPVVENVPLYKGSCYGWWDTNDDQFEISVSGDAVYMGDGSVLITGDCTITLSLKQ